MKVLSNMMTSKTRPRVASHLLLSGLAFAGCSDYESRADSSEAPSEAVGSISVAGASGSAPTAGTPGASTNGPSTEGNPLPAGIAGPSNGEVAAGGAASTTGSNTGGSNSGGSAAIIDPAAAGAAGSEPGPVVTRGAGPCDVYAAANTPCVAAYSTVRALSSTYTGPLYQVRRGAPNPTQNTGTGGETQDIGLLSNGFADAAAQVAFCGNQSCSVSTVYDQSGRGNHVTVAKRGGTAGGQFAALDDFESNASAGPLTVGGNNVFSLYMEIRQGYRQTIAGNGMPRGQAPQGIYMLANGTRAGTACCWDFGNVTNDPQTYHTMNTLFLGTAFWGRGAGAGPWFMADFEAGVWAGGSNPGEPGWGALSQPAPINAANPSLRVPFALGFLKTSTTYALRMANLETATDLTTAYEGALPKPMDNQGAVVIGVGGDNSNNSFGTFYEGAIVSGYPSNDTERAVLQNIQAAGYGQ
jgi:non-reducing end alpha-L-arabinofuranosidase